MASKNQPARQPQKAEHTQVSVSQQWSGPLPPPASLEHFNQIIPNGAERIMVLVEREQEHRLEQEKDLLKATIKDTRRAHWMGFGISALALAAAIGAAFLGAHPTVSIALVGLPIAAIIRSIMQTKSNGK